MDTMKRNFAPDRFIATKVYKEDNFDVLKNPERLC